jgi:hypothetical protein
MTLRGLSALPAAPSEFVGADAVLEHLQFAETALANLAELAATDEAILRIAHNAWAAHVELAGTALLVRSDGERWSIHAPAGSDEAEATLAARKLHGLLGEQADDWDLDR